MRPMLKLLELSQPALKTLTSTPGNVPVAQISAHVRKQASSGNVQHHQKENAVPSMAPLLEKLTAT